MPLRGSADDVYPRKREPDGSAVIGHGHPAIDQISGHLTRDVLRALGLDEVDDLAILASQLEWQNQHLVCGGSRRGSG